MKSRSILLSSSHTSTDLRKQLADCGRRIGPFYSRCRNIGCDRCRTDFFTKLVWEAREAFGPAPMLTQAAVTVGYVQDLRDAPELIRSQKQRLRNFLIRTGPSKAMKVRGYVRIVWCPLANPHRVEFHLLIAPSDVRTMEKAIFRAWPDAQLASVREDPVEHYRQVESCEGLFRWTFGDYVTIWPEQAIAYFCNSEVGQATRLLRISLN